MLLQPILSQPSAGLPKAEKPLPDVAPIQLGSADGRSARTEAAAGARRKAWSAVYRWQGCLLHPYSLGREERWMDICEVDAPVRETWGLDRLEAGHAIKLLYLCATPADELAGEDVECLVEAAEAWGDREVSRAQTAQAIELAKRIRKDSVITSARLRPSDRKVAADNVAVPVQAGSYLVMLAAATQGAMNPWQMEWELSLARGRTLIHGRWIYDGSPTLWMDKGASKAGAWMAECRRQMGL